MNKEASITATELAKMGGCQLRMIHEWGYTGLTEGPKNKYTEKARVRGIKLHDESERRVGHVFSDRPVETKKGGMGILVLVAAAVAVAAVAFVALA